MQQLLFRDGDNVVVVDVVVVAAASFASALMHAVTGNATGNSSQFDDGVSGGKSGGSSNDDRLGLKISRFLIFCVRMEKLNGQLQGLFALDGCL